MTEISLPTYEERLAKLSSEPVKELWGTTWYLNDGSRRAHRMDGPAVLWKNGDREYHYYGVDVTNEVRSWAKENNVSLADEMEPTDREKLVEFMKTVMGKKYHIVC